MFIQKDNMMKTNRERCLYHQKYRMGRHFKQGGYLRHDDFTIGEAAE